MVRVTLTKSFIKATKSQQETITGLGLRKLNQSRLLKDTPAIWGMIRKVEHLVKAEKVSV